MTGLFLDLSDYIPDPEVEAVEYAIKTSKSYRRRNMMNTSLSHALRDGRRWLRVRLSNIG